MKAEILKIAGVKSEKEFYKKYPTEETFMKAHNKEFKKAKLGTKLQDKGQAKKLKQLTSFEGDVDGLIPTAQVGINSPAGGNIRFTPRMNASGIPLDEMLQLSDEEIAQQKEEQRQETNRANWMSNPQNELGASSIGKPFYEGTGLKTPTYDPTKSYKPFSQKGDVLGKLGGAAGIAGIAGDLIGGFQQLKQEKKLRKQTEQGKRVSELTLQAASTRPEQQRRRYVRPEDALIQPEQLSPSYGVGTNYLAKDGAVLKAQGGMQIGGNLTEIQNTYAPNNLYDDLGYEPLGESDVVKQYYGGGYIPQAKFGISDFMSAGGEDLVNKGIGAAFGGGSGGGRIGGTLGKLAGTLGGGPVGGMIVGAIGQIAGNLLDPNARKTKKAQESTQRNLQAAAMQSGIQNLQQGQYSAYVRDGGNIPKYATGGSPCPPGFAWDGELEKCVKLPSDVVVQGTNDPGVTSVNNIPKLGGSSFGQPSKPLALGFNLDRDKIFNISGGYRGMIDQGKLGSSEYDLAFGFPRIFGKDKGLTITGNYGDGNLRIGADTKFPLLGGTLGVKGGYSQNVGGSQPVEMMRTQPSSNRGNVNAGIEFNKKLGKTNLKITGTYGAPVMEEGGWVSHDWQPQVITQFGEHNVSDLLKRDPMMDTLRTGGHIRQNNMYPQDQYALGGSLKTTWGGHTETMSHNPYLPGTGETVMFRGKSHEESDGNGHTGIGVTY